MSFVQQEQLGSGKRFVEMFSHPWIQVGIIRSKDDADGPSKGLEFGQALRIRSQRGLQVARQVDESREGARCVCKLGAAAPNCSPCQVRSHRATFGSRAIALVKAA